MPEYTGEKPLEFRTKTAHWYIYPRLGVIKVCNLRPDEVGEKLVPGPKRFELTRKFLIERPDLFDTLVKVLHVWRNQ